MSIVTEKSNTVQPATFQLKTFQVPDEFNETVPHWVRISLTKYFNECQSPGSLLRAVLENDLEEVACHLLASEIWNALPEIVRLLHVAAPTEAYGSPEKVALWLEPEAEPESTPEPTGFTFEERAEMLLDERIEAVAGALFTRLMRERDLCAMEARGL